MKNVPDEAVNVVDQLKELTFCVFDLETTGGNHDKDKIIEIGMIKIRRMEITEEKNYLIQPEIKIPDFIQKLTSIGPKEVENASLIEDVIDNILEFMGDSILVAHNTSFDIPFFNSVLQRLGREPLQNQNLCTNLMTKHLIPNLLNSNLNYMSKIFGIKHKHAHRALDDARATAQLLIKYLEIFIDKKIQKLNHIYYPRNRYDLDLINLKRTESDSTLSEALKRFNSPFLIIFKGEQGVILFAMPCHYAEAEINFIIKKGKILPWETISIKLYGSLLEAIVHFNNHFAKIDNNIRNEIIQVMWNTNLKNYHLPASVITEEETGIDKNLIDISNPNFGDFIIAPHLVPEQFIVYPIRSLHQKSALIFRYPSHQKKLIQHLKSRSLKIQNNKFKKIPFAPSLKKFVINYLLHGKEHNPNVFIFTKNKILKNEQDFVQSFETFCKSIKPSFQYPKDYV